MNKVQRKREREKRMVSEMIALYCRKQHGTKQGHLCAECAELNEYARLRSDKCPFMENKTFWLFFQKVLFVAPFLIVFRTKKTR